MPRPLLLLLLPLLLLAHTSAVLAQPADGNAKINLDFQETELTEVINTIARLTGKNFLYDDRVRGRVTVISPQPVTVDEAYRVFESILQVKGFTTVPGPGGILKIVPTRDAKESPIETVTGNRPLPNRDNFITRLLPMRYVKADAISSTLTPLVSKEASVIAYAPTNTLIITDTSANIRRLVSIIGQIDVETYREKIKIFPIEYADAGTLASHLNEVFSEDGGNANQGRARARPRARAGQPPGQAAATADAGLVGSVGKSRFITDERTNSIIVIATQSAMDEISRMIQLLDYQRRGTGGIHVYRLQNADSEEMAATLGTLTSGGGGGAARAALGGAPGAAAAAGAVADLGDGVRVTADPPTNSLIIQASAESFSALTEVIEALDIRRPQVLVEAVIMEINIGDGSSFGAGWLYQGEFNQSNSSRIVTGSQNSVSSSTGVPGASGSVRGSDLLSAAAGGGIGSGFTSAILGRMVTLVDPNGSTITVPTIQGILTAAASDTDTNILSAPVILTADNEEAEIVVGQEIPVPTTRLQTESGTGGQFQTSQNIARQDVGVTLRVTPQISEGDTVRLNIFQEISEVQSSDPELGPTTSNRQVENTVYVRDGEAVMIGGIISEVELEGESKVPFLGDIPILGWAFKSKSSSVRKTNLLVVLTPRIVRDPEDLKRMTVEQRERFRDSARDGMELTDEEREERRKALEAGIALPVDPNPVRRQLDMHTHRYPTEQLPTLRAEQAAREKERLEEFERLKAAQAAGSYLVQVSQFRDVRGAVDLLERLTGSGYDGSILSLEEHGETLHAVQLGPYPDEDRAQHVAREVRADLDLNAIVIIEP